MGLEPIKYYKVLIAVSVLIRQAGFEPATSRLSAVCSEPTELLSDNRIK